MIKQIITFVSLLVSVHVGLSQGTFQNLDFEAANPVPYGFPYPGAYMTTGSAVPGWDASIGNASTPVVVLDGLSLGGAEVSIINENPSDGTAPIQGNYSVFLFSGGLSPNLESAAISQTATVPAGTESIQLDAANAFGPPFVVTLGGTPIAMVSLHGFVNYELWGGNIPIAMEGQPETLTITEPFGTATDQGQVELDNIVFSPNSITVTPEPDPVILMGVGGALFAAYRRFAPKRR